MKRRFTARARCLAMLCGLYGPVTLAVTVHTWVDENGVRHYADAAPAAAASAERFDIAEVAPADAATDYYSITNQWARVRAEREAAAERELQRESMRQAERAASEQAARAAQAPEHRHYAPYAFPGFGYPALPRQDIRPRRNFPLDRESYVAAKRRGNFVPGGTSNWPRERYTPRN